MMSKINDLIKELCPNGVEYKQLREIADTFIGLATSVTKHKTSEGVVLLHNSDIKQNKIVLKNIEFIDKEFADKNINKYYKFHDIATVHTGDVGTSAVIEDEYVGSMGFTTLVTRIYNFNYVDPYYLCHYFNSQLFKNDVAMVTISDRSNLNQKEFCQLLIPIPPLEIQEEIVRILDKFGELEAELEAELEMRKSQYDFWSRKLLFSSSYPKVKMEDICVVNQGLQIPINQRKKEPGDNRYFYITVQFLKNEGENYYIENPAENVICKKDDILVTRTGSTGKIVYGVEGCFHNNFFKITPIIDLNKKYLYHVLNSNQMYKEMICIASGGTVPDLPHKKFYNIEIFLPTLEEQNRIVSILDKFDDLVNNITIGLPAEIELRKQQYEYYRNKLLNFEELKP